MKKQVIIDKGNGLQQRLSYDDSTNKIIPETTYGPRQTDNVLPVVGKKFITDTGLDVAYGEDCLFCKGKKDNINLPISTQCAILSGIEVSYSTCAGPLFQTTLYTLNYNGIPLGENSIVISFYNSSGVVFDTREIYGQTYFGTFPFSFYLHQNSTNKVVISTKHRATKTIGECVLTILNAGAVPINYYKDIDNMKVIVDYTTKKVKYVNLNKNKNLDYIDIIIVNSVSNVFGVHFIRLEVDKIYNVDIDPNFSQQRFWANIDDTSLIGMGGALGATGFIPILGFEGPVNGFYGNLLKLTPGIIP